MTKWDPFLLAGYYLKNVNLKPYLFRLSFQLAAMVLWRQQNIPEDPFASNWLERLRHMKRLHNRVMEELKTMADEKAGYDRTEGKVFHEDFTDYS